MSPYRSAACPLSASSFGILSAPLIRIFSAPPTSVPKDGPLTVVTLIHLELGKLHELGRTHILDVLFEEGHDNKTVRVALRFFVPLPLLLTTFLVCLDNYCIFRPLITSNIISLVHSQIHDEYKPNPAAAVYHFQRAAMQGSSAALLKMARLLLGPFPSSIRVCTDLVAWQGWMRRWQSIRAFVIPTRA
jgi:hypothetical protein